MNAQDIDRNFDKYQLWTNVNKSCTHIQAKLVRFECNSSEAGALMGSKVMSTQFHLLFLAED